jgi:FAD:protein FMN transferase
MAPSVGRRLHTASAVAMDAIVTIKAAGDDPEAEMAATVDRALGWFAHVERVCSRFDPESELFRLSAAARIPVPASKLLFEAVRFSLEVAGASGGRFDPTVGARQASRGFDRDYLSGQRMALPATLGRPTYRDVMVDEERETIELRTPLVLDLGGVAKGLAMDLAAQELTGLPSFAIDAGGDLLVKGGNDGGDPWRIGIEHPRREGLIAALQVRDGSVCTSGDYARPAPGPGSGEHHLLDPLSGTSPRHVLSCTVVASTATAADALSTAAFVMGPAQGPRFLEEQGVDGMFVDAGLGVIMTSRFHRWLA